MSMTLCFRLIDESASRQLDSFSDEQLWDTLKSEHSLCLEMGTLWLELQLAFERMDAGRGTPLSLVLEGGKAVGPDDLGWGSATLLTRGQVSDVARTLSPIDRTEFVDRFCVEGSSGPWQNPALVRELVGSALEALRAYYVSGDEADLLMVRACL